MTAGVRPSRVLGPLALATALILPACSSGPKDFDNDNDALRREREALLAENERLRADLSETRAKLDELARTNRLAGDAEPEEVARSVPRVAGFSFGRLTGPEDLDDDGAVEVVTVYLRPFDGRQRFVQAVGWLTLRADLLPEPDPASPNVARDPELLGTITLTPSEMREAYRSSPLGTHYTIDIPIVGGPRSVEGTVVLLASFRDAQTGRRHRAQHTMTGAW